MNKIYECSLCGYTSDDSANFENDVCLMCLRIHDSANFENDVCLMCLRIHDMDY